MTRVMKSAALIVAATLALPVYAARGRADFRTLVILGDSYGAGYSSGSLNERHQPFGWGTILATQVGLKICEPTASATDNCFAIPLVSYPGIPTEPILTAGGLAPGAGSGAPRMAGFGRSYNNLSVPGFTVGAALTIRGNSTDPGLSPLILRGLGTEVEQAIGLRPTFIALWLGGNDFLGAVSVGNPLGLTSIANFTAQYNALLDALVAGAPQAGFVVGTLPENFAAAPLTNTLPTFVFDANFQPVSVGGQTFPLIYTPTGSTTPIPVPVGSIVVLAALPRIQTGFGIPPALKAFPPFSSLPNAGLPLTDADIITPAEQATFATTITAYNNVIRTAAARLDIPVADVKGLFERLGSAKVATPLPLGPFFVNNSFIRGGLFSLDGVHLTDIGYALMANEFIKAINSGYKTKIPLANISQFLANNDPALQSTNSFSFGHEFAAQMISVFSSANVEVPAPTRRRVVTH